MEVQQGIIGPVEYPRNLTLREFYERDYSIFLYKALPEEQESGKQSLVRTHVLNRIGDFPLVSICRNDVDAALAGLGPDESAACRESTVRLFELARAYGIRKDNPAASLAYNMLHPEWSSTSLFLPTFAQIDNLMNIACGGGAEPLAAKALVLGFGCGLGSEEMRTLRNEQIDTLRMVVYLPDGLVLPLLPFAAERLASLGPSKGSLFMAGKGGAICSPETVRRALDRFSVANGLPRATYYAMRASLACALDAGGAPGKVAALFLRTTPAGARAAVKRARTHAMTEALGLRPTGHSAGHSTGH